MLTRRTCTKFGEVVDFRREWGKGKGTLNICNMHISYINIKKIKIKIDEVLLIGVAVTFSRSFFCVCVLQNIYLKNSKIGKEKNWYG